MIQIPEKEEGKQKLQCQRPKAALSQVWKQSPNFVIHISVDKFGVSKSLILIY